MKRLNRKGFTLVELLAVIVILAIVVGITLVTVLPTLKESRQRAFELTAQTAADYYEKQYQLYLVGDSATILTADTLQKSGTDANGVDYEAAGLKSKNYISSSYKVDTTNGRVCVKLAANRGTGSSAGDYYDVKDPGVACSSSCKQCENTAFDN